jgi:PAS domain S-box-containing protein
MNKNTTNTHNQELTPYKIIIVEDDRGLNRLIRKNLEREGFEPESAFSGDQALSKITGSSQEILLIDYKLPDLTAREFIDLLEEKDKKIPFIVMTGHGDEKIAVDMMKLGALDYIIKQQNFIQLLIPKVKKAREELKNKKQLAKAREELRKNEEKYRSLVEEMDDLVCRFDLDENPLFVNEAYCRFFGVEADEIDNFRDFVPEEDHSIMEKYFQKLVKSKEPCSIEHRVVDKNNQVRWIHWRNNPITDEKGNVVAFQGIGRDITERKQAQIKLTESERLLNRSQKAAKIGSFIWDLRDDSLQWSSTMYAIHGLDQENFDGNLIQVSAKLIHPEDQEKVWSEIEKMKENCKVHPMEFRIIRLDGQEKIMRSSGEFELDENGEPVRCIGIHQDITEQKEAEQELKKAHLRFELFMENLPGAAYIKDKNDRVLYCNKFFADTLGKKPEELIGENTFAYLSEEKAAKFKSENRQILEEGLSREFEHTYKFDNKVTYWLTRKFPIGSNNGNNSEQLLGTVSFDITERKQAQEALKASENKFRSLVEQAAEMLFLHDTEGNIIDVNQAAIKNTGYSKEELLDKKVFDIDPDAKDREDQQKYWRAMTPEDDPVNFEGRHQRKDGSIYPAEITISKVVLADGNYIFALAKDITERKEAERELRENRNYLSSIFRAASVGIGVVIDRNIQTVNRQIVKITGYSKDELVGQNARMLYPTDKDYEFVGKEKYRQIREKGTGTVETRWRCKNGEIINVLLSSTPMDPADLSQGVTFTALDITKRKEFEKKLKESRNRYQRLVDTLPYGMEEVNLNGEMVFLNKAYHQILGYEPGELIGKHIWDFEPSREETEKLKNYFKKLKEERPEPEPYVSQNVCKDGEIIDVLVDWDYMFNEQGELTGFISVVTDITEKKQAEEELKESEQKYRTVFENTGTATIIVEEDKTISLVNKEFEKLSGFSKDEIENTKRWMDFVDPEDVKIIEKYHRDRRLKDGNAPNQYEFDFTDKDGNPHTVVAMVDMIPHTQKSVASFLDITKLRKAEKEKEKLQQQLLQTQKLDSIGTLAGGVAHDFNNILTVIIGLSQLVLSRTKKSDPNYNNLESILNSAERAAELTRQLLLFSRKQDMDFEPMNLNETVSRLRKMLDRLIGEDIKMHNDFQYDLWQIKADKSQIEQVITNLVVNSRDAMPGGGDLTISTENVVIDEEKAKTIPDIQPGHYVRLDVEDTGHGIDEGIREKIFDPFFTTKGRAKGTGMGLSVVHGIIKKHNGVIDVYSESGEGTIFKIYFPAMEEDDKDTTVNEYHDFDHYRGQAETILVVEDEKSFLNYLETTLTSYNYNLLCARNGEQALNLFREEKENIDLVLSDVVMPDMSGLELAEEIEKQRPELPIILSSGYSDQKVSPAEIREKGYTFIQKPYGVLKILKLLREVLAQE